VIREDRGSFVEHLAATGGLGRQWPSPLGVSCRASVAAEVEQPPRGERLGLYVDPAPSTDDPPAAGSGTFERREQEDVAVVVRSGEVGVGGEGGLLHRSGSLDGRSLPAVAVVDGGRRRASGGERTGAPGGRGPFWSS
jgi:hypothetical protein